MPEEAYDVRQEIVKELKHHIRHKSTRGVLRTSDFHVSYSPYITQELQKIGYHFYYHIVYPDHHTDVWIPTVHFKLLTEKEHQKEQRRWIKENFGW